MSSSVADRYRAASLPCSLPACGANRPCGAARRRGRRGRRIRGRVPPLRGRPGCDARRPGAGATNAGSGSTPSTSPRMRSRSSRLHGPSGRDVVHPARARARGRGRGGEVGGDDVGDEGEVARLEAVAVHRRRASGEQRVDEQRDHRRVRRVRALSRAVHVEVPQRDRLESVQLAEHAAVVLGGELGDRVRRARAGRLVFSRRERRGPAVHAARRRVHERGIHPRRVRP